MVKKQWLRLKMKILLGYNMKTVGNEICLGEFTRFPFTLGWGWAYFQLVVGGIPSFISALNKYNRFIFKLPSTMIFYKNITVDINHEAGGGLLFKKQQTSKFEEKKFQKWKFQKRWFWV